MFLAYKDMWDMPIDPVDGLEKVKEGENAPKRVGHFVGNIVYAIIFIDDLNSWIFVFSTNTAVQFFNDWNQVRNHFLQEFKWPFFKGFRKDCVVSVSRHATNDRDGFIHFNTTFCQKTDQFRDDH